MVQIHSPRFHLQIITGLKTGPGNALGNNRQALGADNGCGRGRAHPRTKSEERRMRLDVFNQSYPQLQ